MEDLSELFQADPESLSNDQIDRIIQVLREAREKHILGLRERPQPREVTLEDIGL